LIGDANISLRNRSIKTFSARSARIDSLTRAVLVFAALHLAEMNGAAWAQETLEAPPRGLLNYCARDMARCRDPNASHLEVDDDAARHGDVRRQQGWFRALLHKGDEGVAFKAAALTPERRDQLSAVQREINAAIEIAEDSDIYGVTEFWATPISAPPPDSPARPRGDCEDYVLEKRLRLLALGWPVESLSIAMAHAPFLGLHVVLLVHTDDGTLVLDNTLDEPARIENVPYDWVSRQTGADLLRWSRFSGALE